MKKLLIIILVTFICWVFIAWKVYAFGLANDGFNGGAKTATTIVIAISPTVNVGDLIIVAAGYDNLSSGTDGDNNEITAVTDRVGNTYTKAGEFTNVQSGAGTGATISVWYCIATSAITSATFADFSHSGSITAKAYASRAFTIGVSSVAIQATGTLANDGADPGSITLSGLPSREYLFLRFSAVENTGSTATLSTGYSAFGFSNAASTTGGGSASNMGLVAEYKIATSTSETTDPTYMSGDGASIMFAFYESSPPTSNPRRVLKLKTHRP